LPTLTTTQVLLLEQQLRELRQVLDQTQLQLGSAERELAAAKEEYERAEEIENGPKRRMDLAWTRMTNAAKAHSRLKDTVFQSQQSVQRLEQELKK